MASPLLINSGKLLTRLGKLVLKDCAGACCGGGGTGQCCYPWPVCDPSAPSCLCITLPKASNYKLSWTVTGSQQSTRPRTPSGYEVYTSTQWSGGFTGQIFGYDYFCTEPCDNADQCSGTWTRVDTAANGSQTTTTRNCYRPGAKACGDINFYRTAFNPVNTGLLVCNEAGCDPDWKTDPSRTFNPIGIVSNAISQAGYTALSQRIAQYGCNFDQTLTSFGVPVTRIVLSTSSSPTGGSITFTQYDYGQTVDNLTTVGTYTINYTLAVHIGCTGVNPSGSAAYL